MNYSFAQSIDWISVARAILQSRALDEFEERDLYPSKKIAYQFSARGHELGQIVLAHFLSHPHDAVSAYYRSRPLLLSLGLSLVDAFAGPLGRSGGYSDGRDIGVVCNRPSSGGATVLPMAGDVGSQYTPAAGWAAAIKYHREVLADTAYERAISVVFGGEGSVATNGFWSALTMATTEELPLLFFIEDNGFAISVPSTKQTPGGDIVENLRSFRNLRLWAGDGTKPAETALLIEQAMLFVREEQKPGLIKLRVPRLRGHSGQDTQTYKDKALLDDEQSRDPLTELRQYLVPTIMSEQDWKEMERTVLAEVDNALQMALKRAEPQVADVAKFSFSEETIPFDVGEKLPDGARINMGEAIRQTLQGELQTNPRMLVFGEDIGPKGGVHAVTLGLQEQFGDRRVFDTSLSEEGIIGRAVGMALAGLRPVAEIQFRKYADPATEQLHNCGTMRWRTANRFSAPIVVRMAGGFARRAGDPWHSVTDEVAFLHATGWRVLVPSNATDAVGLIRTALRGEDPCVFFEHRALLDATSARRPYPGPDYLLPFGRGQLICEGEHATVVTWGGMVERCEEALKTIEKSIDLIDLRTLSPWDEELVLESVRKTRRCLIVHEDGLTAGFGAEIAAVLAAKAFFDLDAPIKRIGSLDIPIPYNCNLMEAVLPSVAKIRSELTILLQF